MDSYPRLAYMHIAPHELDNERDHMVVLVKMMAIRIKSAVSIKGDEP
jgi:hypothetical protein